MLVWHSKRNITFWINKNDASSVWTPSIYPTKYCWDNPKTFLNKNSCAKDFCKPSVLVWHGQNCNVSQIRTKRVGAWPLWFFLILIYIFEVYHFSFAKSGRTKIYFWWCHTNTHGTNLRSSPLVMLPDHKGSHPQMLLKKTSGDRVLGLQDFFHFCSGFYKLSIHFF